MEQQQLQLLEGQLPFIIYGIIRLLPKQLQQQQAWHKEHGRFKLPIQMDAQLVTMSLLLNHRL